MKIKTLILLFLLFFLTSIEVNSTDVTIAWDPVDDARLTGYQVDYGTSTKNYTTSVMVGNVVQYVIPGLADGTTYYIAAQSVDQTDNIISDYSVELVYTTPCAYTITPTTATYDYTGGSGSISVSTTSMCAWTVSTPASWITISNGSSGTGNGTVNYSVSSNNGVQRIQSFTTATKSFTVTQNAIPTYTITASSTIGGTISPSGTITINSGSNQTFVINPSVGYTLSDVSIDGSSVGAVTSYTFNNISANHTINATFKIINYTLSITMSGSGAGTVANNPNGTIFPYGTNVTLIATPSPNSTFSGWSGSCSGTQNTCNITMSSNMTVIASFSINTYTITANAGTGGTISPSGSVNVNSGTNQSFTITPSIGYSILSVTVDGSSAGAVTSYTFSNVTANHTISASFKDNVYVITSSTGRNGTISPLGKINVNGGSSQTFTITPNHGYQVSSVLVDGSNIGPVTQYTFTQVATNHTISVSYSLIKTYTLTATNGNNGSISPSGRITVNGGSSQTFTITPNTNYAINTVTVDGVSKGSISTYTFTNISANHTIKSTFIRKK